MLVSYNPRWPEQFKEIAAEIRTHGNPEWLVEHIGSTAVPGMRAKPIIDLAVRIGEVEDFERHHQALEAIGWRLGSSVQSHPVMVFEAAGIRTRIAHFFTASDWDTVNQRILRDWLRTHPADAVPSVPVSDKNWPVPGIRSATNSDNPTYFGCIVPKHPKFVKPPEIVPPYSQLLWPAPASLRPSAQRRAQGCSPNEHREGPAQREGTRSAREGNIPEPGTTGTTFRLASLAQRPGGVSLNDRRPRAGHRKGRHLRRGDGPAGSQRISR